MKRLFGMMAVLALGAQAQTTNLWIGPTNQPAAGSWASAANWNPDVPDTTTEVANFTADFTTNITVTLDGTTTVNGIIFNDTANSPSARQNLILSAGSPAGLLLFGGTSPFANIVSGIESLPTVIQPPTDISSFTKLGAGWLRIAALASNSLPPAITVAAGALYLDQANSSLVVTASGLVKSGGGQLVTSSSMTLTGGGNLSVDAGRMEVRKGSTNITGNLTVNSNGQFVARFSPYSNQFGDTNGVTTVNGTGQAKFQDPVAFTNAEVWNLNGFRSDGSLQMDYADATLTGPVNITTNTHININTFNHSIRHARLLGLISDGVSSGGVTFTIGYGGASPGVDLQWTNFHTASRFILSASNSYRGATYLSVRSGSTNTSLQVLTVELTNGHNRLPATTVLTLGGAPPGVAANGGASARLLLDGVNQELAGLATLGTGVFNRVSSGTPDLCAITINTASGTTYTFNGILGGPNADEGNLSLTKRGIGTQVLGGANTYTGLTVVLAGVLEASNSFALGSTAANTSVSNVAQLRVSGGSVLGEELILVGGGASGSNLGALRSVNGTNTINGPITFDGGVGGRIQTASGTLVINGGVTSANLSVMFATGSGMTTIVNTNPVRIGTAVLQAHDPGTLHLNTAGNVMGTFNPAWGDTVFIGASNALPTNVVLLIGQPSTATAGSGTLDLNGHDVTCGQFLSLYTPTSASPYNLVVRNSNATPASLIVNQAANTTYEGRLTDNLSLVKDGPGTLTLAGTNTFSNTTFVTNGILALAGGGSLACTSIILGGGAVLSVTGRVDGTLLLASNQTLSGIGQVAGIVTNAGTVAPGSSAGALAIANYVQDTNGVLHLELGGTDATNYDSLAVGTGVLGGALNVSFINGYTPSLLDGFILVDASVALTGAFAVTNLPPAGPGLAWDLQQFGNSLVLSAVSAPPPSGGYDTYAAQIANPADRGYAADPDGDGYVNLLEYVTGGNPTNADQAARMNGARTNGLLSLRFTRDTGSGDATLYVEGSHAATNGASWQNVAINSNGVWTDGTALETGGPNPVNVTVQDTDATATNRFLRLRVTRP